MEQDFTKDNLKNGMILETYESEECCPFYLALGDYWVNIENGYLNPDEYNDCLKQIDTDKDIQELNIKSVYIPERIYDIKYLKSRSHLKLVWNREITLTDKQRKFFNLIKDDYKYIVKDSYGSINLLKDMPIEINNENIIFDSKRWNDSMFSKIECFTEDIPLITDKIYLIEDLLK